MHQTGIERHQVPQSPLLKVTVSVEYHNAVTHAANARHEAMMEKAEIMSSILEACLTIVMFLLFMLYKRRNTC